MQEVIAKFLIKRLDLGKGPKSDHREFKGDLKGKIWEKLTLG